MGKWSHFTQQNPGIQWLIPPCYRLRDAEYIPFDCWRHSSPVRVPETISGISQGYHGIYNVYVYIYIYNGGTPLAGWSIYVYLLEKKWMITGVSPWIGNLHRCCLKMDTSINWIKKSWFFIGNMIFWIRVCGTLFSDKARVRTRSVPWCSVPCCYGCSSQN